MKKFLLIGIILLLAGGTVFAQEYEDFKSLLREVMELMDTFAEDLNNAENADEVVAAIEKYHKGIEPLEPKMDEMDEKYPDIDETNHPEELAAIMEEYAETIESFSSAMAVLMEYMNNPKVMEAMDKFQ
jgi:hypothetical protein